MTTLARHRVAIGVVAALCYLAGAFLIHAHGNVPTALGLLCAGILGSVHVQASPYRHILRFAAPWQPDTLDLDERERDLRRRAYESGYVLTVLLFVIVFMPLSFVVEFAVARNIFWFVMAFAAIAQMLPTLALEQAGPAGSLIADPDD